MCVVSMVTDHFLDKWKDRQPLPFYPQPLLPILPEKAVDDIFPPRVPAITPEEIAEFRKLLERAREYDAKHNEPDCELEEKKTQLQNLAKELGVNISFD